MTLVTRAPPADRTRRYRDLLSDRQRAGIGHVVHQALYLSDDAFRARGIAGIEEGGAALLSSCPILMSSSSRVIDAPLDPAAAAPELVVRWRQRADLHHIGDVVRRATS